jgi:hypothetical protein
MAKYQIPSIDLAEAEPVSSRFGSFRRRVAPALPQILYWEPRQLKDGKSEIDRAHCGKHDVVRKTDAGFRCGAAWSLSENFGIR